MIAKQYRISIAILGLVAALGSVLQLVFGSFNLHLLVFPVNLIVVALLLLTIAGLLLYREKAVFRVLSGTPFSVVTIGALLICCIVMGLIPQSGAHHHNVAGLLSGVTSSWPFVFIYLIMLLSLGCVIARNLVGFSISRWPFYLNHIGLWLIFVGAGLGSGDYREVTVKIHKGETAVQGVTKSGMSELLPYAIRLDDFRMEEYPLKWGVVDIRTNKFQPEKKPLYYDTEQKAFAKNLSIGTHERIASTRPEPKSFASKVTVVLRNGKIKQPTIRVNHPYRRGSWTLYQSGYDREAGPDSTFSIFKAVRDPWLPVVYAGIVMLALGAFTMLKGRNKKRRGNGVA